MARLRRKKGTASKRGLAHKEPAPPFRLPKKLKEELPSDEQAKGAAWLWDKADGRCALCDELLPADGTDIDVDHRSPRSDGGTSVLQNLFLAHRHCNRRRGNLPFDIAVRLARFYAWAETVEEMDFEAVLKKYVSGHGQQPSYRVSGDEASLDFGGGLVRTAQLFVDPATGVQYFFTLVPVRSILNDDESQPRHIYPDHVRALAQDFVRHPVHEPSNVRLVLGPASRARLLQFDGQHKTTAQVLLGRDEVPVKVYVAPDLAMLQELVVAIQQGIKKRPLSTSETLRKLGDVMRALLEEYVEAPGVARTEKGLIARQPAERRAEVKRIFLQDCMRGILLDDDCELKEYVSAGRSATHPVSDRVAVEKLIRPMIYQGLIDDDMDSGSRYRRDHERQNVIMVLNEVVRCMIGDSWNGEDSLDRRRAQNFFYQGAIGWWVGEVFLPAVHYGLRLKKAERDMVFLRKLSRSERDSVKSCIRELCSWPIWSTTSKEAIAALRSNTVERVAAAFPDYDDGTLRETVYG